ncbi:DUF2630 family protein [uncultured Friedmanniella sp.]|uniref:DUF2630 family protein n=1 Tax=uncultured Friedmanniella sp. TaxID=335381 RepID=UPI0035CC9371
MEETEILTRIAGMVESEHELRQRVQGSSDAREPAKVELRRIEEALDQCWDLLRQRRARVEYGEDPDEATSIRPVSQVEGYLG